MLICGAFCTYIGFFDLFMRQRVTALWREKLDEAEIKQKEDMAIIAARLPQTFNRASFTLPSLLCGRSIA